MSELRLKFSHDYKKWKDAFNTEKVYTRRQMQEALKRNSQEYVVNRVIQSFTDKIGPNESRAMQILAVHKTPQGITVIVK